MNLKVDLYTPSYPPDVGGNATSTARLVRGLEREGVGVRVHRVRSGEEVDLSGWSGGLIHAFHAYRSGSVLLPGLRARRPPLVVSLAGTDVNRDLRQAGRFESVCEVCDLADALVVMHEAAGRSLTEALPQLAGRIVRIPPGVFLPEIDGELDGWARGLRHSWGVRDAEILFFLPAGLRAVKRPAFAIEPLDQLRKRGIPVALVVMGAVLDPDAAEAFDRAAAGRPWVRRLPPRPFQAMNPYYRAADVVLNTSESEGLSNAVLEAMAAERAVLVSDIVGNRACVADGDTGLLFEDEASFVKQAERLARDAVLRKRLGRRARAHVAKRFDPDQEVRMHRDLYQAVLARRSMCGSLGGRTDGIGT